MKGVVKLKSNLKRDILSRFPYFTDMNEFEMNAILPMFEYATATKNTYLFTHGESVKGIYFLAKGRVKYFRHNVKGKEQLVNFFIEHDIFPHLAYYFHIGQYPATAYTVDDIEYLFIPIDRIEQLLHTSPTICLFFLHAMGKLVVDLHHRLEYKLLATTNEQVAELLIRLSERFGMEQKNGKVLLKVIFQHTDLANMLGIARETVSRIMNTYYTEQIVEKRENGQLLIDVPLLKEKISPIY